MNMSEPSPIDPSNSTPASLAEQPYPSKIPQIPSRKSGGIELENPPTTGLENYLNPEQEEEWRLQLVDTGHRAMNNCWDHFKKYKSADRSEYVVCLICLAKELNNARDDTRLPLQKKYEIKYGAAKSTSKLTSHVERKHRTGLDGEPITKKRRVSEKKEKSERVAREPGAPNLKVPKSYKFTYFDEPSIGEPIRMLMKIGKLTWEDERVSIAEWANKKVSTKWGQLPYLTMPNGEVFSQTSAIVRFVGRMVYLDGARIYPDNTQKAMAIDEYIGVFEEIRRLLLNTLPLANEDKLITLTILTSEGGAVYQLLAKMEVGFTNTYLCGDRMTLADVWAFWMLTFMKCGFWYGLPANYLEPFPKLSELCLSIRNMPVLREYFAERVAMGGELYAAFSADP